MKERKDDSQPVEVEREPVQVNLACEDLVFFTRNVCEHYVSPNPEKKTKVNFLSSVDQLNVNFDEEKMQEVFETLWRNAAMFTPDNLIISVGLARTKDDKVQIQVADNGIGIKDEYKEHAFDPIVNGEGVGLDRVKEIIEAHGGTIHLEDNPGGGAIFVITLPMAIEEIEEAEIIED